MASGNQHSTSACEEIVTTEVVGVAEGCGRDAVAQREGRHGVMVMVKEVERVFGVFPI